MQRERERALIMTPYLQKILKLQLETVNYHNTYCNGQIAGRTLYLVTPIQKYDAQNCKRQTFKEKFRY